MVHGSSYPLRDGARVFREQARGGIVEVDETYVGGKAENMDASKRAEKIQGRGAVGKAPVVTLVEREGRVKSIYGESVTGDNLKEAMKDCIVPTAQSMTDESPSYSFAQSESR